MRLAAHVNLLKWFVNNFTDRTFALLHFPIQPYPGGCVYKYV